MIETAHFRFGPTLTEPVNSRAADGLSVHSVCQRDLARYYALLSQTQAPEVSEEDRSVLVRTAGQVSDLVPPRLEAVWIASIQHESPDLARRMRRWTPAQVIAMLDACERGSV